MRMDNTKKRTSFVLLWSINTRYMMKMAILDQRIRYMYILVLGSGHVYILICAIKDYLDDSETN